MKKDIFKIVIGVITALCIFSMIGAAFSFFSESVLIDDLKNFGSSSTKGLLSDAKWLILTLAFVLVPTIIACIAALVSNGKGFKCVAVILNVIVFILAIVFLNEIRVVAKDVGGQTAYAMVVGYITEILQLSVLAFVLAVINFGAIFASKAKKYEIDAAAQPQPENTRAVQGGEENEKA